ncbi:hypothetical protein M8818_002250 [Zalaria obscura]|uniref:Uncharacterized protein n=1 Tax=Zalaria obscura TaxID=2024903 RepID=A0ACC3SIV7_9PEZI
MLRTRTSAKAVPTETSLPSPASSFHGNPDPPLSQVLAKIRSIDLDNDTASAVEVAIGFERSNWAGYSVLSDSFYTVVPENASSATPGSILKVENYMNSSLYTLAPNVALSRILFQSANANESAVPASAFILWPWNPRKFKGIEGFPVVSWAHGTSGWSGECGPSHIRNLWYQFSAPFALALQGYVVVAPDYAGLGLDHDAKGNRIPHQYLANNAAGYDLIYAAKAAQEAYPQLSKEFVVMGHSQGGGAAWGAAQIQAEKHFSGYLGTIAGSPTSAAQIDGLKAAPVSTFSAGLLPTIGQALSSIFPSFRLSDWLTAKGVARTNLLQELQGCQSTRLELLSSAPAADLIVPDWTSTWYLDAFNNLTGTGGKPISEPMLVLQGTADPSVNVTFTDTAVNETCSAYPESQIEYVKWTGVSHVPVLFAAQTYWLDWIADRFSGKGCQRGCTEQTMSPALPVGAYQKELAYFLEYPLYGYETA